jgi:type IV pilus assembly protein PilO
VVALGYYGGFYRSGAAELAKLRSKELELQRKLSEVRSVAANIGAFEEEIRDLESRLDAALSQLPDNKDLEVLLTDISNLGKSSGVEIRSFKRKPEVAHEFYAEVPIDIELVGTFHDIARFFDRVAKLPRIVNMGTLSMSTEDESIEETRLSVKGTATTFRFIGRAGA